MTYASMASRRGILQACGASMLAIGLILYKKAIEFNGPIGSITRKLTKLGSKMVNRPLVYMILYPWLAILFIVDDLILSIERILESRFPLLQHVFDKIDSLVGRVENLPKEFEYAMKNYPEGAKEKEIKVDTNSDNKQSSQNNVLPSSKQGVEKTEDNNAHTIGATRGFNKDSPQLVGKKDASKNGKNENPRINSKKKKLQSVEQKPLKNDNVAKDHTKKDMAKLDNHQENKKAGNKTDEHPLLDIFDFGWEAPKSTSMSRRRASYT